MPSDDWQIVEEVKKGISVSLGRRAVESEGCGQNRVSEGVVLQPDRQTEYAIFGSSQQVKNLLLVGLLATEDRQNRLS
jgi:hypothetical protein